MKTKLFKLIVEDGKRKGLKMIFKTFKEAFEQAEKENVACGIYETEELQQDLFNEA